MQCPDCGYMMAVFDKTCPRCEALKTREKACPQCGTVSRHTALYCSKCRHEFGKPVSDTLPKTDALPKSDTLPKGLPLKEAEAAPSPKPAFVLGVPFAPSPMTGGASAEATAGAASQQASVLPADYLACRVCGNLAVQKVSVICETGTWSGVSQGQSVGAAYTPNGPVPVVQSSTSDHSGATILAQTLMPPARPSYQDRGCMFAIGSVLAVLALCACVVCIAEGADTSATVIWLVVFGAGVSLFLVAGSGDWKDKKRVAEQIPIWQQAMAAWNRLFYCSRCGHVFDPASGAFAPAGQMRQLL